MTVEVTARNEPSAVARHIAQVAARLFATQGYDATAVRTIVEAAGVTKPTLYYHFGSKEGLARALLTVPMSQLGEALRAIVAAPGDPVRMLERVFEAHFDFCREDPDRARFTFALLFGPQAQAAGLAGEMERFKRELPCVLDDGVRRLAGAGLIAPGRVGDCVRACRGLIVIAVMDFLYSDQDLEPGLERRLVGDLLRGFGEPGATGRGESR